jgi:hypothetical protein
VELCACGGEWSEEDCIHAYTGVFTRLGQREGGRDKTGLPGEGERRRDVGAGVGDWGAGERGDVWFYFKS